MGQVCINAMIRMLQPTHSSFFSKFVEEVFPILNSKIRIKMKRRDFLLKLIINFLFTDKIQHINQLPLLQIMIIY